MGELIPTFFVLCIGAVAAASWARRFTTREQQLIMASLGAHALAACAQVWITRDYYGIGDMLLYHETGVELARLIRFDPGRFLPEVASLLYHERPYLPVFVLGAGGSSGTTSGSGTAGNGSRNWKWDQTEALSDEPQVLSNLPNLLIAVMQDVGIHFPHSSLNQRAFSADHVSHSEIIDADDCTTLHQ